MFVNGYYNSVLVLYQQPVKDQQNKLCLTLGKNYATALRATNFTTFAFEPEDRKIENAHIYNANKY